MGNYQNRCRMRLPLGRLGLGNYSSGLLSLAIENTRSGLTLDPRYAIFGGMCLRRFRALFTIIFIHLFA